MLCPSTAPATPPPTAPTPLPSPFCSTSRTDCTVPSTPGFTGGCGAWTTCGASTTGGGGGVSAGTSAAATCCTGFGFAATCFFTGCGAGMASGAAAGAGSATGAGACAAATGVGSVTEPFECGISPVSAAIPTAEKRVNEIAASVSSGCSFLVLVSIAYCSCVFRECPQVTDAAHPVQ